MKKILLIITLPMVASSTIFAQSLDLSKYVWNINAACDYNSIGSEVYQVVEEPPKLTNFPSKRFRGLLSVLSDSLAMSTNVTGKICIELEFFVNHPICVRRIGTDGLEFNEDQFSLIMKKLEDFAVFNPGVQSGVERNCRGLLWLSVDRGYFETFESMNFRFTGEYD